MSITIRPYDEYNFIIEGDVLGRDDEFRELGARLGKDENDHLVWGAPHHLRARFQKYIELDYLYLKWTPFMMLEIIPIQPLEKIQDALTRIGRYKVYFGDKVFYRIFHLIKMKNRCYFVHHLEVLELKGRKTAITFVDLDIRDTVANRLREWGYFQIADPSKVMSVTNQMLRDVSLITPMERDRNFWCTVYDSL